jgi:AmmeMemoRadiSam system protein B
MNGVRRAAVAGTWYPGTASALADAVDRHLANSSRDLDGDLDGDLVALVSPHAGLIYSGPVAAHAYRLLRARTLDVVVLVGPSHFVDFDGVAAPSAAGFETPFGVTPIASELVESLIASGVVHEYEPAHVREHSLEMQLPFLHRVAPRAPIVPLLMARQTPGNAAALADVLVPTLKGRNALLIASTDLSHYHDAGTASRLDSVVLDRISGFDVDGLERALAVRPEHACGGGPLAAVMRAAKQLGARDSMVLHYADSGDVSGDKSRVVGYVAAAFGTFAR